MTSMINLKASRKTGTINVGVNPITNINVSNPAQAAQIVNPPSLTYPDPNFPSVAPTVEQTVLPMGQTQFGTAEPDPSAVSYKSPEELEKEALLVKLDYL